MQILVTGGTGYIGSHTCVELLKAGYEVVVLDNLSNSNLIALDRVKEITGKEIKFYKADLLNKDEISAVFHQNNIEAVIHFAGLKAVGESNRIPLKYYQNNITGTLNLCEIMGNFGVKRLVFSSSATVYSRFNENPLTEDSKLGATNPYGRTKLMLEQILEDLYISDKEWNITLLRYFNPIGAHESTLIGEDPNDIPNNLVPYITQVAVGKLDELKIFGNDYPTPDGTGLRDYIHVIDLAIGHIKALDQSKNTTGFNVYNLGTGNSYSVLDVIKTFEEISGKKISYKIVERRSGDIAVCYANPEKAFKELNWKAERDLKSMLRDSWNWQRNNKNGYSTYNKVLN
ncbi:UDP-glucose 4-epimerase GalE [Fictibacillus arsenicus]|uniref:UDP-glucose 4-epimerase n=1 Tax=Fictibacillus arsenicus TaxID=255247 RepID=A0A1B1Z996_9BACL|nr:UDP-glucose 4-epimerase GalE [Fictibacillus arsenicus]ANX13959.1 UDP-glucose 4-epimerase GalE [Fictibacillus arsenicus]